jgi:hypothetical protein
VIHVPRLAPTAEPVAGGSSRENLVTSLTQFSWTVLDRLHHDGVPLRILTGVDMDTARCRKAAKRSLPMSNRLVAALRGLYLTRPDLIDRNSVHGQDQCTSDSITNLLKRAAYDQHDDDRARIRIRLSASDEGRPGPRCTRRRSPAESLGPFKGNPRGAAAFRKPRNGTLDSPKRALRIWRRSPKVTSALRRNGGCCLGAPRIV